MIFGCNKKDDSTFSGSDSMSQQIGDAMVAMDDSGGSTGGYAFMQNESRTFAKAFGLGQKSLMSEFIPQAEAAACSSASTWSACSGNIIVRNFQGCTIGSATLSGSVNYNYVDGAVNNICSITTAGHSITRVPNFTITGPGGATFTVSKTGSIGQRITANSSSSFSFSNDGIRRVLAFNGTTLSDWTTSTASPITISGATRNGRVATGGALRVLNNKTSVSCDFAPASVTWGASCNCATSGSWSATCSSGGSATYTITGCGQGTLTYNGSTENVSLDQCAAI